MPTMLFLLIKLNALLLEKVEHQPPGEKLCRIVFKVKIEHIGLVIQMALIQQDHANNMESNYHLSTGEKPSWLEYPAKFNSLVLDGHDDFDLWYLMESSRVIERRKGLLKRYPERDLVPFAKRDDNDDIACWDSNFGNEKVVVIHDFASSGYEQKEVFDSFVKWLDQALVEAEEF